MVMPYIFLNLINYIEKYSIQNNSTERKILVTGIKENIMKIHCKNNNFN